MVLKINHILKYQVINTKLFKMLKKNYQLFQNNNLLKENYN